MTDKQKQEKQLLKLCKTLSQTPLKPWQERNKALKELDDLVPSLSAAALRPHTAAMVDALKPNLKSLRSELVRAAAATLASTCREMGQGARHLARQLLPTLVEVSSSGNSVIRKHGLGAAPAVLQSVHTPALLDVLLREMASAKSRPAREATAEFLRQALAFWPIGAKYGAFAETLEEAVKVTLTSADKSVRATGSSLFHLLVGHFPQRRAALFDSLDARQQRAVEKAGKTVEEESQEYHAATKIAAVARARIVRKRTRDSITLSKVLLLGERVRVRGRRAAVGTVRFHGEIAGKTGPWVGVVLDEPIRGGGDGTAGTGGERLMDCDKGCSVFMRIVDLERIEGDGRSSTPPLPDGDEAALADADDRFANGKLTASPLVLLEALRNGPPAEDGAAGAAQEEKKKEEEGGGEESAAKRTPATTLQTPEARHQRGLSVVETNERDLLVLEHKLHLKATAELLDEEMNLVGQTGDAEYVDRVIALMDRFVESSKLVRAKFSDWRRRAGNLEVVDDEFLSAMDNFQ